MMIKIREMYGSALHGCDIPLGTAGAILPPVELDTVVRFGKCNCYGDSRQWTIAELADGQIVYLVLAEQDREIVKLLQRRLKGIFADALMSRAPAAFRWE